MTADSDRYGAESLEDIGQMFNMENDDIETLLNDIRDKIVNKKLKFKRMANKPAPSVYISPKNVSSIEEEETLFIECNANTSESATVLLKHNGEIIHEWHIL